jgi:hypothetical protein
MDWLIPFLVISDTPRPRRRDLTERLLPAAFPGADGQRLAVAAMVADRQVRRQGQVEEQMVREAVATGAFRSVEHLAEQAPAIHAAYQRLPPAVQATIQFPARNA